MKILKCAIIFVAIWASHLCFSGDYDIAKITTKNGMVYTAVDIISSDKNGLLFRHSGGIAKENFSNLSNNIRDMFLPIEDVPAVTRIEIEEPPVEAPLVDKASQSTREVYIPDLTLTLIIRKPASGYPRSFCDMHPNPGNWPSHWHRFHPAHYLTNPVCRAAVTRNFLETTGLLPRPCGVVFHPSPGPTLNTTW
jgi:hypothetical protein